MVHKLWTIRFKVQHMHRLNQNSPNILSRKMTETNQLKPQTVRSVYLTYIQNRISPAKVNKNHFVPEPIFIFLTPYKKLVFEWFSMSISSLYLVFIIMDVTMNFLNSRPYIFDDDKWNGNWPSSQLLISVPKKHQNQQ